MTAMDSSGKGWWDGNSAGYGATNQINCCWMGTVLWGLDLLGHHRMGTALATKHLAYVATVEQDNTGYEVAIPLDQHGMGTVRWGQYRL